MDKFITDDFKIHINRWSATSGNGNYYYDLDQQEAEEIAGANGSCEQNKIQVVSERDPFIGVTENDCGVESLADAIVVFIALLNQEKDECSALLDPNCPNFTLEKAVQS